MIPDSWKKIQLGKICQIKHGFAFKSEYFSDSGPFILLTPGNFFEEGGFRSKGDQEKYYIGDFPREYLLQREDLLIAMTEQAPGLLGSSALIPENDLYLHNQRLGLITDQKPDRIDKHFLYQLFNSRGVRTQIHSTASGTKVRHTSPSRIYEVEVLLPPLDEQRRIAEILGRWDEAITLTGRLIEARQRRKKGLMQRLLTGRVRFGEFVESGEKQETKYIDLPVDWQHVPIAEIAKQVSVKNKNGKDLTVLSCTKYEGLVDSLKYFGRQIYSDDTSTYKVVRRGQFAYATNHIEEGSIGYQDLYDEALISPMYTVFETTHKTVDDAFLYRVLKTELYRHIFEVNTSASVNRRGSLRWNEFSKIKVPLPSLEEQLRIAAVLQAGDEEIELLGQKLSALKRQKSGLMQQLLTGKVRV